LHEWPDAPPSSIYGAEHLLRLFGKRDSVIRPAANNVCAADISFCFAVKIPRLLADVVLPATELNPVQTKFSELLKYASHTDRTSRCSYTHKCCCVLLWCFGDRFLQKNHSTYFVGEYVPEADAINRDVDIPARVAALEERRKEWMQSQDADDDEQEEEEEKEDDSAAEVKEADVVEQKRGRAATSGRDSDASQNSRNSKKRRSRG
jgi:hypothetical protein